MTEREKIIKVIDEWASKAVTTNKFDGASVYNPYNAAELADTLIAAGIGDVEEAKRKAFVYNREITHLDGILKGAERRAELAEAFHDLKCKDYDLLNYQFEKIKHRADVAERAVREFAVNVWCVNCPYKGRCSVSNPSAENDYQECYDEILKIAEKELAEEKKDD